MILRVSLTVWRQGILVPGLLQVHSDHTPLLLATEGGTEDDAQTAPVIQG
jgi:hypothetical protein